MIYTLFKVENEQSKFVVDVNINFEYQEEKSHSIEFNDALSNKFYYLELNEEKTKAKNKVKNIFELENFLKRKCKIKLPQYKTIHC